MMERYIICRKFGADVHLTAAAVGGKAAQNMIDYHTTLMTADSDYWCPRQFHSHDNPKAHIDTTGPEIWEQTNGEVDYFVAGAGGRANGSDRSQCGHAIQGRALL
jgi:cysteine synthase A